MRLTTILLLLTLSSCRLEVKPWSETLTEGNITLSFPNDTWKKTYKREDMEVFTYVFQWGNSSDERFNHGSVQVYIAKLTGMHSSNNESWLIFKPKHYFQIENKFDNTFQKLGFANITAYSTNSGYMINGINRDKGIQILFNTSDDMKGELEDEFKYIIESIKAD